MFALPASHSMLSNDVVFIAGLGKSILWYVGFEILLPIVTDVVHQFYNHTRY